MKAPAFWDRPVGVAALALWPLGALVGLVDAAKAWLARPAHVTVPVICVGNPTVGGTGKTPTVLALVERLRKRGELPFVLTRGHGGSVTGPHRVDRDNDTAAAVGDEALLVARHVPVVVDRDRARGADLAIRHGASVLVMDDGLQNRTLAKDAVLAVIDGGSGFGNGLVTPAGPLRGFPSTVVGEIDLALVIGEGEAGKRAAKILARETTTGRLVPDMGAAALAGRRVHAFCGIGRPEKFRRTLEALGADIVAFEAFADHHPFTADEVERLTRAALASGSTLVTTEKDHARLGGAGSGHAILAGLSTVVRVETRFDDEAAIERLIDRALSARRFAGGA